MIAEETRLRHYTKIDLDRRANPVDPWAWVETDPTAVAIGRSETLFAVGNGYLGIRANPEEGLKSEVQGTYINGFHETFGIRHAEDAFGLARTGQNIVNVPDAKTIRIYVDDEPLNVSTADIYDYERRLDFREGILRRKVHYRTSSGKRVEVTSTRMVSFVEKHLAVFTIEISVLDASAPIIVSSQLLNRQDGEWEYGKSKAAPTATVGADAAAQTEEPGFDPRRSEGMDHRVLIPELQTKKDQRLTLGYCCANSGMTIAAAIDHRWESEDNVVVSSHLDQDSAKVVFQIDGTPGSRFTLTKYASYHTSHQIPPRELGFRCHRTLDRALRHGVNVIHQRQHGWLTEFWERTDVEVDAPAGIQQAIRWNLWQLAQAAARAETQGVPAKGVTGSGYSGHYFWDTEVYVMPFLTYTLPHLARNALRFRSQMLPAARARAKELGHNGALYPWRTINGEEASAYYAAGTAQYHIDADIAYALTKYVEATGDVEFIVHEGVDMLVETARMWADLGFHNARGEFHIHGVTGPDEYTTVVNDNLYTNVMAQFNLRAARYVVREMAKEYPEAYAEMLTRLHLTRAELEEWKRAADAMFIPFDEEYGIHPQDAHFLEREVWDLDGASPKRPLLLHYHPLVIYRYQVLKQADVVLALFLRGDQFTLEEKAADYEYYDALTTGDSTLSAVVQSIVAAEIGKADLAMRFFKTALYTDLADLHDNAVDGVHVASTGGVWSALACGFGGFRDHNRRFSINPRLPEEWDSLTYRVQLHGSRLEVTVLHGSVTLRVAEGEEVSILVWGTEVTVKAGEEITIGEPVEDAAATGIAELEEIAGLAELEDALEED